MIIEKLRDSGVIHEIISLNRDDLIKYVEEKTGKSIKSHDTIELTSVDIPKHFKQLHTHSDIEARYFLEGSGSFCIEYRGTIYKIDCEKDHLLIIPRLVSHYFVPSKENYVKVLRLFTNTNGWQADFVSQNDDTNS